MIASQWELTREELDELSLESHRRAAEATDNGQFKREILPVTIDGDEFSYDEGIRRDTSLEKLGSLTPSFQPDDGVITAGKDRKSTRLNSSHVAISYAVFCLKKKKKHTHER